MSAKILQVNFMFNVSGSEYEQIVAPLADQFAALPGLRWKIWLFNAAEKEAGGLYLFEDEVALRAFVEGPLAAAVMSHPALSGFSVKHFDVLDHLSAITRGPVAVASLA
jgi:hypothetical protein